MKPSTNGLFYPAIGISAAAHVALLLLLPYRAAQPPQSPARELIPVVLLHRPIPEPASRSPAGKPPRTVQAQPPGQELPAPLPEPTPEPMAVGEEVPREPAAVHDAPTPVEGLADEPESVAPGAEIAAYQSILSTLRGRIVASIHYPAIARAKGWKGTVVLSVRLDSAGRLEQAVVRRSSGYEVLDRAAAALLLKVTPVSNPLSRPVSIEIPIVYELK